MEKQGFWLNDAYITGIGLHASKTNKPDGQTDRQPAGRPTRPDFNTVDVFNTERDQHNEVILKIRMAYDKKPSLTQESQTARRV
jgi:hypothetical protein